MNNYIKDTHDELLAFPELTEIIHLEPEQIEEAWKITESVKAEQGQLQVNFLQVNSLQVYFQALGLVAFEEWLKKREPNLLVNRKKTSLSHPESAQEINAVCNLQVGEFKVCLIPSVGFSDELIDIPRVVINDPELAAHLYVVVGVEDELEVAAVRGFVRYDELVNLTSKIPVLSDDSYEVSFASFHQQTDELLLYLQCLSAVDIPSPILDKQSNEIQKIIQDFPQKAINVGLWLQNKLDEVAQELSWSLLPAPSLSPLRFKKSTTNPVEDLESILTQIGDLEIPAVAARSYGNIQLGENQLRLYTLAWCLPDTEDEWSLLVILGAVPPNNPPLGVKLGISDLTGVLDEQVLEEHSDCLYAQIVGTKQEKFLVTVTSADGKAESSVPFEFC